MEQWKEYKIGDIVEANIDQLSAKDDWEKALYLDTGNITENRIDEIQEFVCSELPSRARRKVKDGDIVFSTVRPNQRHYGYINNPPTNLLVSTGFAVLSANRDIVCPKFLYYWLCRDEIVDYLQNIAEQAVSAYPSLKASDICDLFIKLPAFEEQHRIATILSSLDDKIEVNRRINDNLEQQAQALFRSWFVDFEPFGGTMPRDWEYSTMGDLTVPCSAKVKDRDDVRVLSPVSSGDLVLSDEFFTKQVYSKELSKYIVVSPQSFAYNPARVNIGSIGMNEYSFDGCVSPVYVVFSANQGYEYYINSYIKTDLFKQEVALRAIGGVRQTLSYQDFSLIQVVKPSLNIVQEYTSQLLKLKLCIANNNIENKKLASLRDTLLPKLMSGEISVKC